jgi:hypothetical protein
VLQKFSDLDEDGIRDENEPMLAGIPFEIVVGDQVHQRETDLNGVLRFCLNESAVVHVRENTRALGGSLALTTRMPAWWDLTCGDIGMMVGNAPIKPPKTGAGGLAPRWVCAYPGRAAAR